MSEHAEIWAKKVPWQHKLVLIAIDKGYTTPEEIATCTKFTVDEVNVYLESLRAAGLAEEVSA